MKITQLLSAVNVAIHHINGLDPVATCPTTDSSTKRAWNTEPRGLVSAFHSTNRQSLSRFGHTTPIKPKLLDRGVPPLIVATALQFLSTSSASHTAWLQPLWCLFRRKERHFTIQLDLQPY
ncbi:hypothetical protein HMPREF3227_00410 [Corynebacterium sp. CMW7794]|nr:hypothetical protein HMPREF3227_00410 [Corynebacterium sp. CMW7794]